MADPTMWVSCIECRRQTSHDVLRDYEDFEEDDDHIRYRRTYSIVRCRGCYTTSFAEAYGMDDGRDEYGNWVHTLTLYPSRTAPGSAETVATTQERSGSRMCRLLFLHYPRTASGTTTR